MVNCSLKYNCISWEKISQSTDKLSHLSIRKVIWILTSDSVFVFVLENPTNIHKCWDGNAACQKIAKIRHFPSFLSGQNAFRQQGKVERCNDAKFHWKFSPNFVISSTILQKFLPKKKFALRMLKYLRLKIIFFCKMQPDALFSFKTAPC